MEKLFGFWFALSAIMSIAWVVFVIWAIVKVMQHFGIV